MIPTKSNIRRALEGDPGKRHHFSDSDDLCRYLRETTGPTCILAFSRGKDSIGAWLQLRRHFERVIPFHLYLIPGMSFEEESIAYYEEFFEEKILQFPQVGIYRLLDSYVFQLHDRLDMIDDFNLNRDLTIEDIHDEIRARAGVPGAFVATGVRAADSPIRGTSIRTHGPVNYATKTFLPVYDWRMDRLIDELTRSGVKLPRDYEMWGRTFDGIDYRFMEPMRRMSPADYERVKEWFPLVDLEILRRQAAK
jgi:hypothetical protein